VAAPTLNPQWNEDLVFVVAGRPFEEQLDRPRR
jgi:hypothetical protein